VKPNRLQSNNLNSYLIFPEPNLGHSDCLGYLLSSRLCVMNIKRIFFFVKFSESDIDLCSCLFIEVPVAHHKDYLRVVHERLAIATLLCCPRWSCEGLASIVIFQSKISDIFSLLTSTDLLPALKRPGRSRFLLRSEWEEDLQLNWTYLVSTCILSRPCQVKYISVRRTLYCWGGLNYPPITESSVVLPEPECLTMEINFPCYFQWCIVYSADYLLTIV